MRRDFNTKGPWVQISGVAISAAIIGVGFSTAKAEIASKPLFLTGPGKPPNILLIPDTSESMQEGLDGRVALDWDDPDCIPGEDIDSEACASGAAHPQSKGSIVKRVGLDLVENYRGQINLGLLSYQQAPPSEDRDDAFDSATVPWRLAHRAGDVRYSDDPNPYFYDPDFNGDLMSDTKRFREPHPELDGWYVFYNFAIPGYMRDASGDWPLDPDRDDFTSYFHDFTDDETASGGNVFPYRQYETARASGSAGLETDPDSSKVYDDPVGTFWRITITDSMRLRGLTSWGTRVSYAPTGQTEWRSNVSPGLGYLHVPIGGFDGDGNVDADHWERIEAKLQPQRHDWESGDGNVLVDPEWPLINSGLTPLEGTMRTARDYFNGSNDYFGPEQGNTGSLDIPESCDVNAAIWVTDGVPTVASDGTELGDDLPAALEGAEAAIRDFFETTEDVLGEGVPTYIVGFGLPPGVSEIPGMPVNPLDQLASAGRTGQAFDATREEDLDAAMTEIFDQIVREAQGSAGSIASNTTSLQAGAAVFQAGFDSADWSGELQAFRLRNPQDGAETVVNENPAWDAESQLPAASARQILTWVPDTDADGAASWAEGTTVEFNYSDDLNDDQLAYLDAADGRGEARVAWLRGDQAGEGFGDDEFRSRNRLLGDIVYSEPLFVHSQNYGYSALDNGGETYQNALEDWADATPMVLVAANDGKLHAFDGLLPCDGDASENGLPCSGAGGTELFSVVPNSVYDGLADLTSRNFSRDYLLDGSPKLGHVYDGGSWRRIVVVSQGRGGSGVMAMDIDSREVLWEINSEHSDLLGAVIGDPVLTKAPSGDWVTIIPNGPYSDDGRAGLLVLDTLSGEILNEWVPEGGGNDGDNGMFSPVPVDIDGDRMANRLYAGDLQGNLWRFELTENDPGEWGAPDFLNSGGNDIPLFQAEGPNPERNRQPITSRPAVARGDQGEIGIFFGTGQFFATGDNDVEQSTVQSLYGVRDNNDSVLPSRQQLLEQEIFWEGEEFGFELRATTDHTLEDERGWVMDLVSPNAGFEGERVTEGALVRGGDRVVFSTLIPLAEEDPCQPGGGTGWIMEFDAFSGARLERSPWDLSGDGFGEESFVETSDGVIPTSGIKSPVGIPSQPRVLEPSPEDPEQDREYKLPTGSDGDIWEMPDEERTGYTWRSWRQIR